jgi:hypothetical protein
MDELALPVSRCPFSILRSAIGPAERSHGQRTTENGQRF